MVYGKTRSNGVTDNVSASSKSKIKQEFTCLLGCLAGLLMCCPDSLKYERRGPKSKVTHFTGVLSLILFCGCFDLTKDTVSVFESSRESFSVFFFLHFVVRIKKQAFLTRCRVQTLRSGMYPKQHSETTKTNETNKTNIWSKQKPPKKKTKRNERNDQTKTTSERKTKPSRF